MDLSFPDPLFLDARHLNPAPEKSPSDLEHRAPVRRQSLVQNRRGQGMIEYLILVALIAVGSMAIVRVVGKNVSVQFANVAKALGSGSGEELKAETLEQSMYSKRDMSNFLSGAINESARDKK